MIKLALVRVFKKSAVLGEANFFDIKRTVWEEQVP